MHNSWVRIRCCYGVITISTGDFIFENEEWKYNKNYLIPLPRLGKNCDYRLKRVTDE